MTGAAHPGPLGDVRRSDAPRVFITGASSGIGAALAREYAARGAVLGLLGRRRDALEALAAGLPGSHHIYTVDVTDHAALAAAARDFIAREGGADIVIASSGISYGTLTERLEDLPLFEEVLAVNFTGTVATFAPFIESMKPGSGARRLVAIGSMAGIRGMRGAGAYCASKAAVHGYCESLRLELKPYGIRVVTIAPGYVATPMTRNNRFPMPFLMSAERFAARAVAVIARGRGFRVIPWQMGAVAALLRLLPNAVFDALFSRAPQKARKLPGGRMMDAQRIALLSSAGVAVEVVRETGSTNADLLARVPTLPGPLLLIAEHQTAGRGRAGRPWLSAPGHSLTFSLAWRFEGGLAALTGLPLAVGTALAGTLGRLGQPVQLKWPNDLLKDGDKLAGILVETQPAGGPGGATWAVVGIGLNLAMPDELEQRIGRAVAAVPWLARMDRDTLMAALLDGLAQALREFAAQGFAAFSARWNLLHAYQGQPVTILDRGEVLHEGLAAGVDDAGRLLLDTEQGRIAIVAGDVSLRVKT